jgi:hypothetical protein
MSPNSHQFVCPSQHTIAVALTGHPQRQFQSNLGEIQLWLTTGRRDLLHRQFLSRSLHNAILNCKAIAAIQTKLIWGGEGEGGCMRLELSIYSATRKQLLFTVNSAATFQHNSSALDFLMLHKVKNLSYINGLLNALYSDIQPCVA